VQYCAILCKTLLINGTAQPKNKKTKKQNQQTNKPTKANEKKTKKKNGLVTSKPIKKPTKTTTQTQRKNNKKKAKYVIQESQHCKYHLFSTTIEEKSPLLAPELR
jgi:hypothetical protein